MGCPESSDQLVIVFDGVNRPAKFRNSMSVPKFTAVFTRLEEGGFYATVLEAPKVNATGASQEAAAGEHRILQRGSG
jgi:hypothetical protein